MTGVGDTSQVESLEEENYNLRLQLAKLQVALQQKNAAPRDTETAAANPHHPKTDQNFNYSALYNKALETISKLQAELISLHKTMTVVSEENSRLKQELTTWQKQAELFLKTAESSPEAAYEPGTKQTMQNSSMVPHVIQLQQPQVAAALPAYLHSEMESTDDTHNSECRDKHRSNKPSSKSVPCLPTSSWQAQQQQAAQHSTLPSSRPKPAQPPSSTTSPAVAAAPPVPAAAAHPHELAVSAACRLDVLEGLLQNLEHVMTKVGPQQAAGGSGGGGGGPHQQRHRAQPLPMSALELVASWEDDSPTQHQRNEHIGEHTEPRSEQLNLIQAEVVALQTKLAEAWSRLGQPPPATAATSGQDPPPAPPSNPAPAISLPLRGTRAGQGGVAGQQQQGMQDRRQDTAGPAPPQDQLAADLASLLADLELLRHQHQQPPPQQDGAHHHLPPHHADHDYSHQQQVSRGYEPPPLVVMSNEVEDLIPFPHRHRRQVSRSTGSEELQQWEEELWGSGRQQQHKGSAKKAGGGNRAASKSQRRKQQASTAANNTAAAPSHHHPAQPPAAAAAAQRRAASPGGLGGVGGGWRSSADDWDGPLEGGPDGWWRRQLRAPSPGPGRPDVGPAHGAALGSQLRAQSPPARPRYPSPRRHRPVSPHADLPQNMKRISPPPRHSPPPHHRTGASSRPASTQRQQQLAIDMLHSGLPTKYVLEDSTVHQAGNGRPRGRSARTGGGRSRSTSRGHSPPAVMGGLYGKGAAKGSGHSMSGYYY